MTAAAIEAQARALADGYGGGGGRVQPRLSSALAGAPPVMVTTPAGGVATWRVGEGPAVLLLHGYGDSHRLWSPLMASLAARVRAFVVIDMPGSGFSDAGPVDLDGSIEVLRAVVEATGPIDALVTHSMAIAAGLTAVAEGVVPAARVVTAAAAPPHWQSYMTLGGRPGFSDHPPEVLARAQAILADRIPPSPRFDTAVTDGTLTMPVLLVHCRDDRNWSLEGSRALAARMPRARLLETQGLGHRDVARDPAVVAVIADFLSDARQGVYEPPEQTGP